MDGEDRIERQIDIEAPVDRVWALVSEPGWWVGDGDPSTRHVSRHGGVVVVAFPPHGRFPVVSVTSEPPGYAAFRGGDDPDVVPAEGNSTLVEFFLTEQDGGTRLRVVESGFAALYRPAERQAWIDDNTAGWEMQLGVAKRDAERVRA